MSAEKVIDMFLIERVAKPIEVVAAGKNNSFCRILSFAEKISWNLG
jgi:hypothetical protein